MSNIFVKIAGASGVTPLQIGLGLVSVVAQVALSQVVAKYTQKAMEKVLKDDDREVEIIDPCIIEEDVDQNDQQEH